MKTVYDLKRDSLRGKCSHLRKYKKKIGRYNEKVPTYTYLIHHNHQRVNVEG